MPESASRQLELPFGDDPPVRPRRAFRIRKPPSHRSPRALARLALWLAGRLGARRRVAGLAVIFNPRLRSSTGRACFRDRVIELNPHLLDRHPEELVPTLAHELGHLVAGARAGHGPRWRAAVEALGFQPETCHRLPVDRVARRAWQWICPTCAGIWIRHHRGARRFACTSCGTRLRLAGAAPPA